MESHLRSLHRQVWAVAREIGAGVGEIAGARKARGGEWFKAPYSGRGMGYCEGIRKKNLETVTRGEMDTRPGR